MNSIKGHEQKIRMQNKLNENSSMDYQELLNITNAFQVASGQNFAIGNTKALLDHLLGGKPITILNFDHSSKPLILKSVKDLASVFKKIDQYIDLPNDSDFKKYF